MEPLDLREHPPRAPHAALEGVVLLPRTIDKARALLPGGNPGVYFIGPGISSSLLEMLRISEDEFVAAVGAARDDAEVAARVCANASPERRARWTAAIEGLTVAGVPTETRPFFDSLYGPRRPYELVLDVLASDDDAMFALT
ncbi:MAG: hypothetical protein JWO85_2900 [Candidatus Eremiobacteraeota bacterium]|nr:hypothetical protein [Candidatus Eremiobacteraeota bacterium]